MKTALLMLLVGISCGTEPVPGPAGETDSGRAVSDAGDPCGVIPTEYRSCSRCHSEATTIEGWYSTPAGSHLESDTWGRSAFFVLFTQSNSATITEHRTSYGWPERCFCQRLAAEPWQCSTLDGEF
ncbi:MAG TPA: hypothetical protein ENK57_12045 [Polyangiaceae bacterium]|nr:hypothetical protein [Polyangiaceae bacterium]